MSSSCSPMTLTRFRATKTWITLCNIDDSEQVESKPGARRRYEVTLPDLIVLFALFNQPTPQSLSAARWDPPPNSVPVRRYAATVAAEVGS